MTRADTIRISMHSQRYDALKTHMKQLAITCYNAVRSDFDSTQCNSKQKQLHHFFMKQVEQISQAYFS